jgi:hypothetical protein
MKNEIDVPEYNEKDGIRLEWEYGFLISAKVDTEGKVIVKTNSSGLISLARHLLVLAQETVPSGSHIHLDDSNSLEDGSNELLLERL